MSYLDQQLQLVFQACDRNSKGFVTEEDIKIACDGLIPETDKCQILEIFRTGKGIKELDFEAFKDRVGGYFTNPQEVSSPYRKNAHDQSGKLTSSPAYSLNQKDSWAISPFMPMLNSSLAMNDSKLRQSMRSISRSPYSRPSSAISSRPSSAFRTAPEDTYEGSGEEKGLKVYKRRRKITRDMGRFKKRKCQHEFTGSSSETSPEKPTHADKVSLKMDELTRKLEQVKEATAQSRLEITSLFDHFINKSSDGGEDSFYHRERRRKIDEIVKLETELIRLKLEAQLQENDKLRIQNREIWIKLQEIDKEKQDSVDMLGKQKEFSESLEEKLHNLRIENRDLGSQLDSCKIEMKKLEEHLIYVKETHSNEIKELDETKKAYEREKSYLRREKMRLFEQSDHIATKQTQLLQEREEIRNEKRIMYIEMERLRNDKESFYLMKSDFEVKRKDDECIVLEAANEYSNLLQENNILKENLDQLANEKESLTQRLEDTSKELKLLKSQKDKWHHFDQIGTVHEELSRVRESLRQKELVIHSLMEVVERTSKGDHGKKSCLDQQIDMKDAVKKLESCISRLELTMSESREIMMNKINDAKDLNSSEARNYATKFEKMEEEMKGLYMERDQLRQYCEMLVKKYNQMFEKKNPRWRK